eukprot:TRINITY_DN7020_c1_g1_i1.p2 TRINITY_DN7020_c1_g1~~TRINITY_DN7020_c1_g1_i1.p2  ORF type:complete len:330 (-),score=42.17 TRINITY_DN7020_c1_g1_i1:895-1806(-)
MRYLFGMEMEMEGKDSMDPGCTTHSLQGSEPGHQIPGALLVVLGMWWTVNIFSQQLTLGKKTFKCRAWQPFPLQSLWLLEPTVKVVFAVVGTIIELFVAGHGNYRKLYDDYGYYCIGHLNNWQHSAMYASFGFSGLVDLLGADGKLPKNLDTGILGIAFFIFGQLMAFHLKGSSLEVRVHIILVLCIFYTMLTIFGEMRSPDSFMMSCAKCHAVILTGSWLFHVGIILYGGETAWDEESMGGAMFAPVVFGGHILVISALLLLLYVFMLHTNFVIVSNFQIDEEGEQIPSFDTQPLTKAGNQD